MRTSTSYTNNRSVEFVATFTALNQRAGLASDFSTRPWARFEVRNATQLLVGTGISSTTNRTTNLGGALVGAPHRFRIDWNTGNVVYSVDGVVVATHNVSPSGSMRPFVGDGTAGGGGLTLSWMRLTPYPASGTYTSRVLDAGRVTTWRTASWLSSTPAGTGVTIRVRSGNTATPDATWTPYTAATASGAAIDKPGRFLQYEVVLTSSSNRRTPELQQVTFVVG